MYFRFLTLLAVALAVVVAGCRDDGKDVDVNAVYHQLMEESKRNCKEDEDSLYREDSEQTQKASSYSGFILRSDMHRWLQQNRAFRLREEDYYFSHPGLRNFDSSDLETHVFDSPLPRAYMCANGTLYISSSFLDPESPLHLTDDELTALIAHEFVHFRDSHVLIQRGAAMLRDSGYTAGRILGPLSTLSGDADVAALFADEAREFQADRGALAILSAHNVPVDAYASLLSKLFQAAPPGSVGAAALAKRQVCLSLFLKAPAPQRFFWMTPATLARMEAEGLVLVDERRDDARFFLRYDDVFHKVFASKSLSSGPPPPGAVLIPLTPKDIHVTCEMAQVLTGYPDARARPVAEAFSRALLIWLSGTGKETLNEVL